MTFYTGYISVPHSTYDEWKNNVNGNGYNVDNNYGYQCWDLASLFWWNVGFPQGYPTTGGTHSAYGIWDDKEQNAGDKFDLIYNKNDIKRGDIIVYNYGASADGHIGFADEDYNGTDNIQILSQNNGGTTPPDQEAGSATNVANYSLIYFRGAFRYKNWETTPPTPTPVSNTKFPFVLYAKRLRNRQQGML